MRYSRDHHRKAKGSLTVFISLLLIFLILIYEFLLVDQKIKPAFIAIEEMNPSVS
ncbi:MAG: hypothetical protein N4A64_00520 [Marinisporobacter sp.]|nr:hypothetical protein [Marinisporobacter sp.]